LANNIIRSLLGGIYKNDLWLFEISCTLASQQNFNARTHLMLQKLTLPLSEECVLVLLTPVATPCLCIIFCHTADAWLLLPTNHCATLISIAFVLWLTLHLHCNILSICCCYNCNICNWKASSILNQLWSLWYTCHLSFGLLLVSTLPLRHLHWCWLCPVLLCIVFNTTLCCLVFFYN